MSNDDGEKQRNGPNARVLRDSPQARRVAERLNRMEGPVSPRTVALSAPKGSRISLYWPKKTTDE